VVRRHLLDPWLAMDAEFAGIPKPPALRFPDEASPINIVVKTPYAVIYVTPTAHRQSKIPS
jgi:hypothetical protein